MHHCRFLLKGGRFSHFGFYQGNATTIVYCIYDGPFDNELAVCGQGTITYPENDDGYRQYEGSLCGEMWDDAGWCGQGTLTLTDGTTYTGEFLDEDEKYGEESGPVCVLFRGKCVSSNSVVREGRFRLVDPAMRIQLCGKFGEGIQRNWWEEDAGAGYHDLDFDDWKDRQTDLLTQLKCQSKTPLE